MAPLPTKFLDQKIVEATRDLLTDTLIRRAGELAAHLGRYDMYALLVESILGMPQITSRVVPRVVLRTRGESIRKRLQARSIPQHFCDRFIAIDEEIQPILARQEICASNSASIASLGARPPLRLQVIQQSKDWFDFSNLDETELQTFIDGMERDVLQVVTLYMRMATLAKELREYVVEKH